VPHHTLSGERVLFSTTTLAPNQESTRKSPEGFWRRYIVFGLRDKFKGLAIFPTEDTDAETREDDVLQNQVRETGITSRQRIPRIQSPQLLFRRRHRRDGDCGDGGLNRSGGSRRRGLGTRGGRRDEDCFTLLGGGAGRGGGRGGKMVDCVGRRICHGNCARLLLFREC
jgi:hypothetical protein